VNEWLDRFLAQPTKVKVGGLLAAMGVIAGGFWFFAFSGVYEQVAALEKEVDEKTKQVVEKTRIAANLPKFEAEVAALDVQLKRALEELPSAREIPGMLSRISDEASKAGLDIKLFRPQSEKKFEFYAEIPVEIKVRGTYHEVGYFLDELSNLERIVNVTQLKLSEPQVGESETTLVGSMVTTAFRFLEESERPKVDPDDGKDGKKKRRGTRKQPTQ
jgi:type IV pilus assembly protein PilO